MTVITETRIQFTKLSSRIGAEIRGLDLSADLSPDTVAQLRDALNIAGDLPRGVDGRRSTSIKGDSSAYSETVVVPETPEAAGVRA